MRSIDAQYRALKRAEATEGPSRRRFAVFAMVRKGFTLAECMIACLVLGIALTGLAVALSAAHQSAAVADERGDMLQAARELVEEIAARPFLSPITSDKPGWSMGQTDRRQYDDVFDFAGYSDLVPIEDLASSVVNPPSTLPGYRRTVTLQMRSDPATPTVLKSSAAFAYVEVTVTGPSGDTLTLPYWSARTVWRR
jgi:prepilin-type N-terminal cleavage/methylation domain-containing protein